MKCELQGVGKKKLSPGAYSRYLLFLSLYRKHLNQNNFTGNTASELAPTASSPPPASRPPVSTFHTISPTPVGPVMPVSPVTPAIPPLRNSPKPSLSLPPSHAVDLPPLLPPPPASRPPVGPVASHAGNNRPLKRLRPDDFSSYFTIEGREKGKKKVFCNFCKQPNIRYETGKMAQHLRKCKPESKLARTLAEQHAEGAERFNGYANTARVRGELGNLNL